MTCIVFYLDWTCDRVSRYVMFNPIYLCFNSSSFIRLSFMNWYNEFLSIRLHWVQYYKSIKLIPICRIKRIEFHSLFYITFNYLESDVLLFTFHVEDGERLSQPCSDEHDWFSPDLLQIPEDGDVPILPVVISTTDYLHWCDRTSILLSTFYAEVNTIYTCL